MMNIVNKLRSRSYIYFLKLGMKGTFTVSTKKGSFGFHTEKERTAANPKNAFSVKTKVNLA